MGAMQAMKAYDTQKKIRMRKTFLDGVALHTQYDERDTVVDEWNEVHIESTSYCGRSNFVATAQITQLVPSVVVDSTATK